MQDFKRLKVWAKAHRLTLDVFRAGEAVNRWPPGLRSQLYRAAASIPTNIAEGTGKQSQAEFKRFIEIAAGSAKELEYHLILARDLQLIPWNVHLQLESQTDEVRRMLFALWRVLGGIPNTAASEEQGAVSEEIPKHMLH